MGAEPSSPKPRITPAEYLVTERAAEHKSDYYRGEMFSMAGGTSPHARIAANLIIAIGRRLDDKPCQTYTSDMKVHVPGTEFFAYPDVSLLCGEGQFVDEHEDCLLNPGLIAEVLSPSTQNYDREKFFPYQQLPSLNHYLLVHQKRAFIEHFIRPEGGGEWSYKFAGHPEVPAKGLADALVLHSLGLEIPLSEIYRLIRLEPFLPPSP